METLAVYMQSAERVVSVMVYFIGAFCTVCLVLACKGAE